MCHGDDFGLVLPPAVAPVQAVVVVVKDADGPDGPDGGPTAVASGLVDKLKGSGVRARLDDNVSVAFGRRATDWDLQGVPVRLELGPRDVAENSAMLFRRDTREKTKVGLGAVVDEVRRLTARIQTDMLAAATARRDAYTTDCATLDEAREAGQTGVARVPWKLVGTRGEEDLAASRLTVRCLQRGDGSLPDTDDDAGAVAFVARAY
jgi:prolyl-tRNA synthetase